MRILVTNDDGVRAPGIAALASVAAATGHDVVVVAPLIDYSGAGAAVGPVHSRAGVDYEAHAIEGLGEMPTYGIDGPPALAVILACVGGFGPRPDIVLSGINHGVNVGRSAMHSGTVGAALTAAHFGLRCLAVSIRWGDDPVPWETPATMAAALVPVLEGAPAGTTLNLNVPNVGLHELRGLRHGRLGRGGTIRSAVHVTGGGDNPLPTWRSRRGRPGRCVSTSRPRGAAPGCIPTPTPGCSLATRVVDGPRGGPGSGTESDDVIDDVLEALYAVWGSRPGRIPTPRASRAISRARRSRSRASRSSGTGSGRAPDHRGAACHAQRREVGGVFRVGHRGYRGRARGGGRHESATLATGPGGVVDPIFAAAPGSKSHPASSSPTRGVTEETPAQR